MKAEGYDNSSGRGKRIGKRAYPLKKIIERNVDGYYFENYFSRLHLLECGHKVPPVPDIYGETSTNSMRCRLCHEEKLNSLIPTPTT